MMRELLAAFGLGLVGAVLIEKRGTFLRAPVEGEALITPHGAYGADRQGPPAHAHQGVDLVAAPGSRVLAVGDGRIVETRAGLGGIVRKLELDEPMAFAPGFVPIDAVVYADLGRALVEPGDRVRRGERIAVVGDRGFVHFAVKLKGGLLDPRLAGLHYSAGVVS